MPQFSYGLGIDLGPDVETLVASDIETQIFGATGDMVFRLAEYYATLSELDLGSLTPEDLITAIPGSHNSPLTNPGKEQLNIVSKWITGRRFEMGLTEYLLAS
jgi:hypothetical protein